MYFFLTNHCKMECSHCCANASPRGRKFMSEEVFRAGLKFAEERGEGVFLGGGEPTDHPNFLQYLVEVLASDVELEASGVITNGSNTKEAMLLSRLHEVIYVALSMSEYHHSWLVSPRVVRSFQNNKLEIRKTKTIYKQGRGKNFLGSIEGCACEGLWMDYNGDVYECGCKKVNLGNVLTNVNIPEDYENECSER